MIYFFYGSDTDTVRKKAFAWVSMARKKEPNLVYVRLSANEITKDSLSEISVAKSLFVNKLLVLVDNPFPKARKGGLGAVEDTGAVFMEYMEILANSDNVVVVLAPEATAVTVKKITAMAVKEYRFDGARAKPARGFNSALVNALGAKDSKKLWLEIARALRSGDTPEMLHGLLHWKARNLMEKGSRAWSPEQARAQSIKLITIIGEARRTGTDLSRALEFFALSVEK